MLRKWHRSEAAEGRSGSLTKFGVTECVTDCRRHDGHSYWFVVKIREVVPVPKFQEFKCYRAAKELAKCGMTESMMARRDLDDPSQGPIDQAVF
ncbi:hypothetical protein EJD97_013712 [Solanum chilense]|uniref:Uncharacterized protein n=1 Tax=Solanum chilense TaxID=4083 RepID=A0A6N2CG60_SOLCI|nr:hypothetical protein EJD97_013712 [Solanum chilense]